MQVIARLRARVQRADQPFRSSRWVLKLIAALFFIALLGLFANIWLFSSQVRGSVHWKYFHAVITGNWSSDQPRPSIRKKTDFITDREYAVGLIGAIFVNYGPYGAIVVLAWKVLIDRRNRVMNLKQAISVREEVTKDFLTDIFSQSMTPEEVNKKIATAYEGMEDRWKDRLGRMIGPNGVNQVLRDLERPIEP